MGSNPVECTIFFPLYCKGTVFLAVGSTIRRKGFPAQRTPFDTAPDAHAWACMIVSEIDQGFFVTRVEAECIAFCQLIDC
jgi:hypothetical protein